MRRFFILVITIAFISSCINKKHDTENAIPLNQITYVRADLLNADGRIIYLQKAAVRNPIIIDSLRTDEEGIYETSFRIEKPGFYSVRNQSGDAITFIADGGDSVFIESNYSDFRHYDLSGSRELEEIEKLNEATQKFLSETEKLAATVRDSISSPSYTEIKLAVDRQYQEAYHDLREFSIRFLKRNSESLISLLALTNQLGPDFYVFHPLKDLDIFIKTDSILIANYPETEPVKDLHTQINLFKSRSKALTGKRNKPEEGEKAPEISLNSPEGNEISLKSARGKYVLLDFWASWCPPCRRENPNLVENYKKYNNKGFEIFQVSLDKSKDKWTQAIEEDKLDWIHVSDLKYWDSKVVNLYNITSIPDNFLLDPHGVIIATNLRGEELDIKLDEIFND